MTKAFLELLAASTGTVHGFVITLVWYIESIVKEIFAPADATQDEKAKRTRNDVASLRDHVNVWSGNNDIKERAVRLLSALNEPPMSMYLDRLVADGVLKSEHKEAWKAIRNPIMHGEIADFGTDENLWHYANRLISMTYRVSFRRLNYRGKVLDYDGNTFRCVDFSYPKCEEVHL